MNIRGLTHEKLFLLLSVHDFDVLCIQETWLRSPAQEEFSVPGFHVSEQRRESGAQGGIAIISRKSLPILEAKGNEFAQQVVLRMPDGTTAAITNVYLPPYKSHKDRGGDEHQAREEVTKMVTSAPAADVTLVMGDFNARIGTKSPKVLDSTIARRTADTKVGYRAPWFIQLCEQAELHILNGNEYQGEPCDTCHTGMGSSTVDYVLSKDGTTVLHHDADTLQGKTDHTTLFITLPVAVTPPPPPGATTPTGPTTYRWDVGTSVQQQQEGIARWAVHTGREEFREGMARVTGDRTLSNEQRSAAMEYFLLQEGQAAGVVSAHTAKKPLNPNRWGKYLAPWFEADCHAAKK